ncbi:hypothetical protein ACHAWC_005581 [Mediolabrus comicus]
MVEIMPYEAVESEDENWIPLTTTAAAEENQSSSATAAASAAVVSDEATVDNSSSVGEDRDDVVAAKAVDNLHISEDEDEDDDGWQKLEALSSTNNNTATVSSSTTSSLLLDLLPALSSITKVTTTAPTAAEDAQSENEDNIAWRRPDELDNTEIKYFGNERERRGGGRSTVYEKYNDEHISSMRVVHNNQRQQSDKKSEEYHSSSSNNERVSSPSRKQPEHTQHHQQQQQQQQPTRPPPATRIKSRLQEKFIHDPLRSLPYQFLCNFIVEGRYQLGLVWRCFLFSDETSTSSTSTAAAAGTTTTTTTAEDDGVGDGDGSEDGNNSGGSSIKNKKKQHTIDSKVLAALLLYSIIGLFGLGLILNGIYHVILAIGSTFLWSIEASIEISREIMSTSMYASLILGILIWMVMRIQMSRVVAMNIFKFPSISTVVSVIVALTSPSIYEVFVIGLSVRTIVSVFKTEFGADGASLCMMEQQQQVVNLSCLSDLTTIVLFAIVAVVSLFLVMNTRFLSWAELEKEEENRAETCNVSSSEKSSLLRTTIRRVRTYPHECHALGIVTLASLSIVLILLRDGVFIFASLRIVKILLSIGIGIFVLERLWDNILETIAAKSDRGAAIRMSLRQISRRALKKSVLDLSKSALWSKDDTGNVILGIFSEEDSELRYALLGWVLDRWTATSGDSSSTEEEEEESPRDAPEGFSRSEGCPEDAKTSYSEPVKYPHAPLRSESFPAEAKFDTKCTNDNYHDGADNFPKEHRQPSISSYESLLLLISRLDADETLIPTINRYKEWVYSLPPTQNVAFCVAVSKLCPAMVIFVLVTIWSVGRSILATFVFYTLGSSSIDNMDNFWFVCIVAAVLWPLVLIEYSSISRWWTKHFKDEKVPDAVIIMLGGDDLSPKLFFYPVALVTDTSALFLRLWKLLLESISFLESSIPVVRYATVACATADLAGDTLCLVDMAFEVQKRGLLGGVGMIIWDAFNHHLKEELHQRRTNDEGESVQHDDDDLGGKYTSAVINSARNIGKISQNVGCLMSSQKGHESSDDNGSCESVGVGKEESLEGPALEMTISSGKSLDKSLSAKEERESVSCSSQKDDVLEEDESSPRPSEGDRASVESSSSEKEETESMTEGKKKENVVPALIGGGLALFGAIVGGLAVAANSKNDEKKRSRASDDSK